MTEKISTKDLYRLRHAHLGARRAAIKAQQTEQVLRELVLELEQRYGLLGTAASIDVHTGDVQPSPSSSVEPGTSGADPGRSPAGHEVLARLHGGEGIDRAE